MYKGMDLTNLAQELRRQLGTKRDLKAPTTCLPVVTLPGGDWSMP